MADFYFGIVITNASMYFATMTANTQMGLYSDEQITVSKAKLVSQPTVCGRNVHLKANLSFADLFSLASSTDSKWRTQRGLLEECSLLITKNFLQNGLEGQNKSESG